MLNIYVLVKYLDVEKALFMKDDAAMAVKGGMACRLQSKRS